MKMSSVRKYWLAVLRTILYLKHVWRRIAQRRSGPDEATREAYYVQIWEKAAKELSLSVVRLPDGFLKVRSGAAETLVYQNFTMMDHPATEHLAGNKPLVHKLLAEEGLPIPEHRVFGLSDLRPAEEFLSEQKCACVVKPANGTGGGEGVTTNVRTPRQLQRASILASIFSHVLLIERQIEGESYRLLYLGTDLIDAIRRGAPAVTGDGRSTIEDLIGEENRQRTSTKGEISLKRLEIDLDCIATLENNGLSLKSVPPAGKRVAIKTAANENSYRENESVRDEIHPEIVQVGARAASALSLEFAGVDVLTTDITVPLRENGGVINEVNTTPALHFHYQVANPDKGAPVAVSILRHLLKLKPSAPTPSSGGK
jgi:cyanophycin synthetase